MTRILGQTFCHNTLFFYLFVVLGATCSDVSLMERRDKETCKWRIITIQLNSNVNDLACTLKTRIICHNSQLTSADLDKPTCTCLNHDKPASRHLWWLRKKNQFFQKGIFLSFSSVFLSNNGLVRHGPANLLLMVKKLRNNGLKKYFLHQLLICFYLYESHRYGFGRKRDS